LVIIDYENAIRDGFVSLSKTITDMMEEEDNEG
jgi:hypothetical protein